MRLQALPLLALTAVCTVTSCTPATGPDDTEGGPFDFVVGLQAVAGGLNVPLFVTAPPGDPRLFIVEQPGRIRVMRDGTLSPEPFLDIRDRVRSGGEQGLLGLAFDPDFRANGRFFVTYTDPSGDLVLSAFQDIDRSDRANPDTEAEYLRVPQPFANHNGGHIAFGHDGMLYLGLGDGGGSGDPLGHGQKTSTLLGALLRIDISQHFTPPYAVPADNPFTDDADARPEVWAYGLRNPWRFSFDRASGVLYIGDVGQDQWEEINAVDPGPGGYNFGWNTMEGHRCFGPVECALDGLTLPVAVYGHEDGCSITGGYVYRGNALPNLQGRYLYADYCEGWIRSFRLSALGQATDPQEIYVERPGRITSFGEDAQGELYVAVEGGEVFKLVPAG